jgi:hypothetical protein
LHASLTNKRISKEQRQAQLNRLLGKPGDNKLMLNSNSNPRNQRQSVSPNQSINTAGMDIDEDDDDDEVNVPDNTNLNQIDNNKDQKWNPKLSLNILSLRNDLAKQVRLSNNPQLQQEWKQLNDDYMNKNPPNLSQAEWAKKFVAFDEKLNGLNQQNASPEPKPLTSAQHSAQNYVRFKLNDKEFMAKVEDKIAHKFSKMQIRQLTNRSYDRIAASNDLENKSLPEIQKAAGKIMMDEIRKIGAKMGQKYDKTDQQSLGQLDSLVKPSKPITSNSNFDGPSKRIKPGDEFDTEPNEVVGSANNNSSSDPAQNKLQIRNYNRNQAKRYLEKDGVVGRLIRDAKQKTDDGKDTRLDGRNGLNRQELKELKAAITEAFENSPKPLISSLHHPVALEATLKFIEMPPDLDQ